MVPYHSIASDWVLRRICSLELGSLREMERDYLSLEYLLRASCRWNES